MNQIVPFPLWIGHAGDGRDNRRILSAGIHAIVQLAVEGPPLTAKSSNLNVQLVDHLFSFHFIS